MAEEFPQMFIFGDEAVSNVSGKVNAHSARIWGSEVPHVVLEHQRDSPVQKYTGHSFVMKEQWFIPQLALNQNYIFQQDGCHAHFQNEVQILSSLVLHQRHRCRVLPNT